MPPPKIQQHGGEVHESSVKSEDNFLSAASSITQPCCSCALITDSVTPDKLLCACMVVWDWMCTILCVFVEALTTDLCNRSSGAERVGPLLKFNVSFLRMSLVDPLSFCGLWQRAAPACETSPVKSQLLISNGTSGEIKRGLICYCVRG